ncbi:MAG: class I SAM-dependent DNA methyltransferase [bacterium]
MSTHRSSGDSLADRRFDYAMRYREAGDHRAAAELIAQALERAPDWAAGFLALGEAWEAAGEAAAAAQAYRAALERDPADSVGAGVRLARLGLRSVDGALSTAHVAALFDDYAPRFETALVQGLRYRGPALLRGAIMAAGPRRFAHALDLGCGTGLMGEALVDLYERIDGVDLSDAMLAVARGKSIYARLDRDDLIAFLDRQPPGSIDLAVAADVLVYLGDLGAVCAAVGRVLEPGGLFTFTVQDAGTEDMRLGADLRYAHGAAALRRWLAAACFAVVSLEAASTRDDAGAPVPGLVCVARKEAPQTEGSKVIGP